MRSEYIRTANRWLFKFDPEYFGIFKQMENKNELKGFKVKSGSIEYCWIIAFIKAANTDHSYRS